MEITQVTRITLEDNEISALQTLKSAYNQCESVECFKCCDCPLYVKEHCIGNYAEILLFQKERNK